MTPEETLANADPKGLIQDAYRIDEISVADCRSIFLDWALSIPSGTEPALALRCLFAHLGLDNPTHPMTHIIQEGLAGTPVRRRRMRSRSRGAA